MYIAKYLLSIEEFMDREKGEALLERASLCVDEERRRKAEGMRTLSGRAACLGAGLLLQFAVEEAFRSGSGFGTGGDIGGCGEFAEDGVTAGCGGLLVENIAVTRRKLKICSVTELLDYGKDAPVRQFTYRYGVQGKPYFRNLPFYFNLSHSGSFVLCGLSMEEIGADIQQHCGKDVGKLGRRFYSKRESMALEQAGAERENLFYRLWARKEAYGKLTGEGIGKALGMDLLPGTVQTEEGEIYDTLSCSSQILTSETMSLPEGRHLVWEEWDSVEGYSIAFCRYR